MRNMCNKLLPREPEGPSNHGMIPSDSGAHGRKKLRKEARGQRVVNKARMRLAMLFMIAITDPFLLMAKQRRRSMRERLVSWWWWKVW